MDRTLDRLAPLSGFVFAALIIAGFVVGGDTPDSTDSGAKVAAFYKLHHDKQTGAAIMIAFGALALIFFSGSLRQAFRGSDAASERRSSVIFGGALVAAVGFLVMAAGHFATADVAYRSTPQVAQALNAAEGGTWVLGIVGLSALMISAGIVAVTSRRVVPVWMGWLAIVLGVVCPTPVGWIAAALSMLWLGALSVMLWARGGAAEETQAPVAPTAVGSPA